MMSSISRLMPSISSSDRRSIAARRLLSRARNSDASCVIGAGDDVFCLGRKLVGGVDDGSQGGRHGGCLIVRFVDVPRAGALQGQEWCFLADVLAFLVCDRLERCLQAIDRVAALAGPEPLGGIVDGHSLDQSRGSLGRGDIEDAAQVQVEADENLVAGRHAGQSLDEEIAHQGIEPDVLVLSLIDANRGRFLAVASSRYRSRCGWLEAACCEG